jgi:hypothetical protein
MSVVEDHPTQPQPQAPRSTGVGLRVAILVIGALTGAVMLFQVFALVGLAAAFAPRSSLAGGAIVVAVLWIVALAAVWGAPGLAALLFVVTAIGAFIIGAGSIFRDMTVWGSIAVILAILALVARWQVRRSRR